MLDPVARFLRTEAGGGVALFAGAIVALLWVNVFGAGGYESFWHTELKVGVGSFSITEDLQHWVNDALMALFFFLISLEVKRELVTGDLREPKKAALPIIAAFSGALLPALIYIALVGVGGEKSGGWGVPMATDAAFAIGVLIILGSRVGIGVKLFLLTIAVVDDVLAILVIAIAYTDHVALGWLAGAFGGLALIALMRAAGVTRLLLYLPLAVAVWIAMLESGVHATIAGVALAFLVPAKPVGDRHVLEEMEDRLHPFTSFFVLPVFALANAGIEIGGSYLSEGDGKKVAAAVAIALIAGKFIGIAGATIAALRLKIGRLPDGVDLRGVLGAAALGGIGFTVSLFIAPLAYDNESLVESAKLGVLAGSVISAIAGVAILAPGGTHPTRESDEGD